MIVLYLKKRNLKNFKFARAGAVAWAAPFSQGSGSNQKEQLRAAPAPQNYRVPVLLYVASANYFAVFVSQYHADLFAFLTWPWDRLLLLTHPGI